MTTSALTYDLSLLDHSFAKWNASPALRAVYQNIFAEMHGSLVPGRSLELGSGIGVARDYFPGLVTSDIVATRYVDRAVSAYAIPDEAWGNIIALDMLHHLQEPLRFLQSAAAALQPGGRIVLAEPAGTPWGRVFYRWFHHEPCRPEEIQSPFTFAASGDGSFANMGMAQALFGRERAQVATRLREYGLQVTAVRYRDLLAYPATGGFSRAALLPAVVLRACLVAEHLVPQAVLRFLALRMIVVMTKDGPA